MKKALILAVSFFIATTGLLGLDVNEILQKAKDRIQVSTTSTRSTMTVTAKDGTTSERMVDQYSAKVDGLLKAVIVFQKPASLANTRFLVIENTGREDDRWIYLPSLGKTRRISAGEGSGSFVGTDFSYDDISLLGRTLAKDTHLLLKEEILNTEACYVIESKPVDPAFQYSKVVRWISKITFITWKADLYDKKGNLLKTIEVGKAENIQGFLTPMVTKITNRQEGSSTTINIQIIKYNEIIPASVFTENYLLTGKP